METLKRIAQTFWIGGLWVIGALVLPVVMGSLGDDRELAGKLAGQLLNIITWTGVACAPVLLFYVLRRDGWRAFKGGAFWLLLTMLVCSAALLLVVFPIVHELRPTQITAKAVGVIGDGFRKWHLISVSLYVLQCVCGLAVVLGEGGK